MECAVATALEREDWIKHISNAATACLKSEEAGMHISGRGARGLDVNLGHDGEETRALEDVHVNGQGALDVHVDGQGGEDIQGSDDDKGPGYDLHLEGNSDGGMAGMGRGTQEATLQGLSTRVAEISSMQSTHSRMLTTMAKDVQSILAILRSDRSGEIGGTSNESGAIAVNQPATREGSGREEGTHQRDEQTKGVVISTPQVSLYDPYAPGPGAGGDGCGSGVYSRRLKQEDIGPTNSAEGAAENTKPSLATADSSLVTFSAASLPTLSSHPHPSRPAPAGPQVHDKTRVGYDDYHNGDANAAIAARTRAADLWNNQYPRKTGSKTIVVTRLK